MLVLRTTDIIPVKIGELEVHVSPLSWDVKTKIFSLGKDKESEMMFETLREAISAVKDCEKYVLSNGETFKPGFDEDGRLEKESLEMLIRIGGYAPFSVLGSALIAETLQNELQGVEVQLDKAYVEEAKKKP